MKMQNIAIQVNIGHITTGINRGRARRRRGMMPWLEEMHFD